MGDEAPQGGRSGPGPEATSPCGQEHEDQPRLWCPARGGGDRSAWPVHYRPEGHFTVRFVLTSGCLPTHLALFFSQITVNDLPVGRSVEETVRLVKAFQFTVSPSPSPPCFSNLIRHS